MLSCFSPVQLFMTNQAPLSMGFSRQEYWSGLPCPPPGGLPNWGTEPLSPAAPALQADSLPLSHRRSPPFLHIVPIVVVQSLSSVQLWHYGLQHARVPCLSLSSRVCSNSCQLSQWCHSFNMWCLFDARHSDSCAVIPICVIDLHFPDY